jgi:hypothetical protein
MFSRLATLLPIAVLVAVAAAAPNAVDARDGGSNCSTSGQYCCDTDQLAVRHLFPFPYPWMIHTSIVFQNGESYNFDGGLSNILSGLGGAGGVTCTPVTALGVGSGADCNQQTVCCTNNNVVSLHHASVQR